MVGEGNAQNGTVESLGHDGQDSIASDTTNCRHIIETNDVTKVYGMGDVAVLALRGINV